MVEKGGIGSVGPVDIQVDAIESYCLRGNGMGEGEFTASFFYVSSYYYCSIPLEIRSLSSLFSFNHAFKHNVR